MRTRPAPARPTPASRGFTLVEMLVVVALVVLMMTILVSIFTAATGAITVARTNAELDQSLRTLDATLRRDLAGVTARLTPPLNPTDKLGYFEYGENGFPDSQGEDVDDYIAFTAKAPVGQPFSGRMMLTYFDTNLGATNTRAVPITSEFAEIIYFLRAGKLYRRVLLIAPERQGAVVQPRAGAGFRVTSQFINDPLNLAGSFFVSWQGVNDLSARPLTAGLGGGLGGGAPVLNTLGDLTNRHNRFARPRFMDDYASDLNGSAGADGITDDINSDGVPDYYPTLYPNAISHFAINTPIPAANQTGDILPFPYVYLWAFSTGGIDPTSGQFGLIHTADSSLAAANPAFATYNHAPLEIGDSLSPPGNLQSFWGFPTWKETMSPKWTDPVLPPNAKGTQSQGLTYNINLPPILPIPLRTRLTPVGTGLPAQYAPLPFSETNPNLWGSPGSATNSNTFDFYFSQPAGLQSATFPDPDMIWEDDLIMTGVRSFDVKAYEGNAQVFDATNNVYRFLGAGYYDLGYLSQWDVRYITNGYKALIDPVRFNSPFGHEGRIPPLAPIGANAFGDLRTDPNYPALNVGDNTSGLVRLRRVFDTWSTDYSRAPQTSAFNPGSGPAFGGPPYYPSYPPPYAAPLRGIQIQVRVTDPSNEHVKILTIRQDFSDKL